PVLRQLGVALLPVGLVLLIAAIGWLHTHNPNVADAPAETMQAIGSEAPSPSEGGLAEPPADTGGLAEPPADGGLAEPPAEPASESVAAAGGVAEPPAEAAVSEAASAAPAASAPTAPADTGRGWIAWTATAAVLVAFYAVLNFQRLEIFKLLLTSFFPLLVMILAVLGSIVFGLATPTEAAAVGAFGGYVLAAIYSVINKRAPGQRRPVFLVWLLLWLPLLGCLAWFVAHKEGLAGPVSPVLGAVAAGGVLLWALMAYRQAKLQTEVKESVLLTAKTSAMVCWLFVGSAIFSAAFALLGGQELVEQWVLGMKLSKVEFLVLSQVIIFILGWPLEWTEIIVIFMPIFIPLLDHFGVDPLFFGLLVALNLQTAFLSPPVAMAAFYLKGVAPPHVTLNQIFAGMLPFMAIQVIAIVLLYLWPEIGLWLPKVLYG
ncbi:MAG TPA: TRAP transporter large permease subunit, partial [Roseateles sp.]